MSLDILLKTPAERTIEADKVCIATGRDPDVVGTPRGQKVQPWYQHCAVFAALLKDAGADFDTLKWDPNSFVADPEDDKWHWTFHFDRIASVH